MNAPLKIDPESAFWNSVKKKPIACQLTTGRVLEGVLEWVSTYSIGIELEGARHLLVMKGSIAVIEQLSSLRSEPHVVPRSPASS